VALLLILLPFAAAGVALALRSNRGRPWLLPIMGFVHLALVLFVAVHPASAYATPWLALDPLGKLVLILVSALFALSSPYMLGYLRYRQERPNRFFCACMLGFLGVVSLVTWARHLGLMWVGIEATSLIAAPLIYFSHTARSIEATWKYLLVGSVGIAMALLGSFFLAYASLHEGLGTSLTFDELLQHAPLLSKPWLHAAFVLLLVGYGTKMGLAPMHTWKPDAYGEAPGVVGAMLAGGVTSCAFLAMMRIHHVCLAAGDGQFSSGLLIFMGLSSMAVAGVFMVGQRDFKRMLAYSSVEHMGILVFAVGIGGPAVFGSLLHLVNNGLTKCVLFLTAGNLHRAYGSKSTDHVGGALRKLPYSSAMFLAGFLAITGSPPFGPFISEYTILGGVLGSGRYVIGALFLTFLMLVFLGMGATVLRVVYGRPSAAARAIHYRDGRLTLLPPLLMLLMVLVLGVYIPAPLRHLLDDAAHFLQVRP
jgi:hydrogenase-4 component F